MGRARQAMAVQAGGETQSVVHGLPPMPCNMVLSRKSGASRGAKWPERTASDVT